MARELLVSISANTVISRQIKHDLESFAILLAYTLYRHYLMKYPHNKLLRKELHFYFGVVTIRDISGRRLEMYSWSKDSMQVLRKTVNLSELILLEAIMRHAHMQNISVDASHPYPNEIGQVFIQRIRKQIEVTATPITYDTLTEAIELAIAVDADEEKKHREEEKKHREKRVESGLDGVYVP